MVLNNIQGLIGFYGISAILDYLMPYSFHTYISNIYDLVWLGFMAYQPLKVIKCQILFLHILNDLRTHFVDNIFKQA